MVLRFRKDNGDNIIGYRECHDVNEYCPYVYRLNSGKFDAETLDFNGLQVLSNRTYELKYTTSGSM